MPAKSCAKKRSGQLTDRRLPRRNRETFRDTMHRTSLATFRRNISESFYWFEAKSTEIMPAIVSKRAALSEYKQSPSKSNLQILWATRRKANQTALTSNGQSLAKIFRKQQLQGTSEACTIASRRQGVQYRTQLLL